MKQKKEMITMLLAGGQGTRLYVLTKEVAKPAVPFGGKYRIIDFPLSNCVNSGIDTVGVLTQYRPLELNSYIGNGQPWDLDRMNGGVYILPPYVKDKEGQWYKGTANAIYQNINFIERYEPDYVLVLSGDHIYKMDYAKMLRLPQGAPGRRHHRRPGRARGGGQPLRHHEHQRRRAPSTSSRKSPSTPRSTKASMGIYIFNWKKLREYLDQRREGPRTAPTTSARTSSPPCWPSGERMFAYQFDGYWKDVGTIDSLWEANMDLLNPKVNINLSGDQWRIYARNEPHPPHFIREKADIAESLITEGCDINGKLWYTVLFSGVTVEEGAELNSAVVMKNTVIKKGAVVKYAIIAEDAVIEEGAVVGDDPCNYSDPSEWGIAVVGRGAVVKKGQIVRPKEMIEPDANR